METIQAERTQLAEQLRAEQNTNLLLQEELLDFRESLADLELAADDIGYRRIVAGSHLEWTRGGLKQITALCRLFAIKNPLVRRGLALRQMYVWGTGVDISARATGDDGTQDVNDVLQRFLDEPLNHAALLDAEAQLEWRLGTDGNLFFALFTSPRTGAVRVRALPWDEITDVIRNPEDSSEAWYYLREWMPEQSSVLAGVTVGGTQRQLYPDVRYQPKTRPSMYGGIPIVWDAPVVHRAVNRPSQTAKFGTPDAYSALDWARAYKEFLEDWARLVKSLSRFAWRATSKGSKAAKVAAALKQAPALDPATGLPLAAGATAHIAPDVTLEAIPKTGATIDSESGRPLATMVAAALDVPVTMLLGDPGVTGARATAETLDDPLRLSAEQRRGLAAELLRTICDYVVDQAVLAPQGRLQGHVETDDYGRQHVVLDGDTERTIDIAWPDLSEPDQISVIDAITHADQTGKVPPLVVARLLLQALGVEDVDEILDELTDDQGNFVSPDVTAGQAAADAFRRGQDPAAVVGDGQPPPAGDHPAPAPTA
jgi:hypothetical protein